MARITRSVAEDSVDSDYSATDLLAILASATNPDGTVYTLPVSSGAPGAADILVGHQAFTASGGTTVITVPAGRTWVGQITIACDVGIAAASAVAGQALGLVSTVGAGATPAAGNHLSCEARAGANGATGTVGSSGAATVVVPDFYVVAPAGNAVTVDMTATIAGTNGRVAVFATGRLV